MLVKQPHRRRTTTRPVHLGTSHHPSNSAGAIPAAALLFKDAPASRRAVTDRLTRRRPCLISFSTRRKQRTRTVDLPFRFRTSKRQATALGDAQCTAFVYLRASCTRPDTAAANNPRLLFGRLALAAALQHTYIGRTSTQIRHGHHHRDHHHHPRAEEPRLSLAIRASSTANLRLPQHLPHPRPAASRITALVRTRN